MYWKMERTEGNKSIVNSVAMRKNKKTYGFSYIDSSAIAITQRKLNDSVNTGPRVATQTQQDQTSHRVLQLKWGWWKNRRTRDMTFYDNEDYPYIHVSWNVADESASHVTYEHRNGSKSYLFPYQDKYIFDDGNEFVKDWLEAAWSDFKKEFVV
ncbi:hypothetical protein [Vibrio cionasavignyae]|uniref:hypothetical protein n=1 Tax=Vibrio cionasavignyae TaxID=2910252 RepID=UPI003D0CF97E